METPPRHLLLPSLSPAEVLAADEVLIDYCEEHPLLNLIHFWESPSLFVVVGYGNHLGTEVNVSACEQDGIPIFRRFSGGGTVLQGPGCFNYSLILQIDSGPYASITETNCSVMKRNKAAIQSLMQQSVHVKGHTDLSVGELKFSGNAQRRKRNCLLFHGTFLLDFDLPQIEKYLRFPSKEPDYRASRPHLDFITNLQLPKSDVQGALLKHWAATETMELALYDQIKKLAREKYNTREWNYKFP